MKLNLKKELSEEGAPPGRKFLLGKYMMLLITLGFLVTALESSLGTNYTAFIGGLSAMFAIFCGGNVGDRWVSNKPTVQVITDRRAHLGLNPDGSSEPTVNGPGVQGR